VQATDHACMNHVPKQGPRLARCRVSEKQELEQVIPWFSEGSRAQCAEAKSSALFVGSPAEISNYQTHQNRLGKALPALTGHNLYLGLIP
jgi:hypothetical protein